MLFRSDDFADVVVDFVQRGVERRGLARAGRAGDEHDAVRELHDAPEAIQLARAHAEATQLAPSPEGRSNSTVLISIHDLHR